MMHPVVEEYRRARPRSRALAHTTWVGSAVVRRVTCIYCREIIATSDSNWPETKCSQQIRFSHWRECEAAKPYILNALDRLMEMLAEVRESMGLFATWDE